MILKANNQENFKIKNPQDFITNIRHEKDRNQWIFIH
jgi:hypothetical protein